jgi:hypothetical protein
MQKEDEVRARIDREAKERKAAMEEAMEKEARERKALEIQEANRERALEQSKKLSLPSTMDAAVTLRGHSRMENSTRH